jgi:anti-sigma-K factor RskA
MIDEELEDQASLYALELLEPEEARAFESRLTSDPELRERVDFLRETAAKLAHGAPARDLPGELEARVMKAIRSEEPAAAKSPASVNWLPWALAACLGIACAILAADRANMHQRLARLEKRNAMAQMQIAMLASQLESAPRANAVVLWDPEKQEGVLKVAGVPPNEANRDYQLWIVDPEYKQPVDAGVFHVADEAPTKISFKPKARINSAKAFAVSLERKGGVPKAEGPMVLMGK